MIIDVEGVKFGFSSVLLTLLVGHLACKKSV